VTLNVELRAMWHMGQIIIIIIIIIITFIVSENSMQNLTANTNTRNRYNRNRQKLTIELVEGLSLNAIVNYSLEI